MVRLREATLQDLQILKHWDEQPHVIASDPNDDWSWEVELTHLNRADWYGNNVD